MTHANTNPSATEVAKQFSTTKSQKVKAELVAYVEAKTKSSKRKRWGNLLKALKGNDTARINAYAATGDEARVAWAKVAKATPAKPKTTAKPKAKAKAKPKSFKSVGLFLYYWNLSFFFHFPQNTLSKTLNNMKP